MGSTSSKSSVMASKILQQVDKIESPPKESASDLKLASASEKLPSKLSPSKLRGQALKSFEHIDSSKFLEIVRDSNRLDDSAGSLLHDGREATSQKPDKVEQNGPSNLSFSNIPAMNGLDDTVLSKKKDVVGPVKSADSNSTDFLAHSASRQNWAFKMSAHEDFFDLDDDGHSNEMPSCTLVEGREKLETSAVDSKQAAAEAIKVEESMSISEVNPPAPVMEEKSDVGTNDLLSSGGKSASLIFPSVPVVSTAVQSDVQATQTTSKFDKTGSERQSNAASPVFGLASSNEQNAVPTAFGFGLINGSVMEANNKVPQYPFASSSSFGGSIPKFGIPSDTKSESSSSFFSVAAGSTVTAKVPEFNKTDEEKDLKDGVVSATPEPTSLDQPTPPQLFVCFYWVTTTSNGTPIFGTSGNLSASTGAPLFGLGSTSASPIFGSTGASSASTFSFTSAASSSSNPSLPHFGNSNPVLPFGSVPSGNNDQMNAEDSMAEDTVVATTPSVSLFGQQPISPQPLTSFMFNSPASTVANPYQFGGQQNLATPPNPSPFQASGSLDLGGGSFSLRTGGDESGRKILRVKHNRPRRK